MINILLCLTFLMFGNYKERVAAKHNLTLMLDFKTAKELHYKYKKDPEMALTLKDIAYTKYCEETRSKFFGEYSYDKEQSKELQDWNFKQDFKEECNE